MSMFPSLANLSNGGPSTNDMRVKLVVTESGYTQTPPRFSAHSRVHFATVSLAEMAVAEYCYSTLNSEPKDDASTTQARRRGQVC